MGRKIQIVFSFFALAMLALFIYQLRIGQWSGVNWGMLGVSASVCLLVFFNFVYIFTFSYALAAIVNGGLIYLALPSTASALLAAMAVLYGLRLAVFTWSRNHSESYSAKVGQITAGHQAMPLGVKIFLWFMCTWLQTFHLMGVYFAAQSGLLSIGMITGAVIMFAGIAIEGIADAQKQHVKNVSTTRFINSGLFKYVRHPNFSGEILVQLGLIIAGFASVAAWNEWVAVALAPAYIILLMITEAWRSDEEQQLRYGSQADYTQWRSASGTLLPWL